jgi:hypothetical protein
LGALAGAMGAAVGGYLFHVGQFEYVFMTLVAFHILGLCFAIRALKM